MKQAYLMYIILHLFIVINNKQWQLVWKARTTNFKPNRKSKEDIISLFAVSNNSQRKPGQIRSYIYSLLVIANKETLFNQVFFIRCY